jgi:hypothetical protein
MELKPFASLGATLLARKGGAKPAMRPQLATIDGMGGEQAARAIAADLEDLGWNDMGQEDDRPHEAQVLPLTPAPANPQTEAEALADDAIARAELAAVHTPAAKSTVVKAPVLLAVDDEAEEFDDSYEADDLDADYEAAEPEPDFEAYEPVEPEVHRQQRALTASLRNDERPERRRAVVVDSRRAAFTLRLDGRRHLKLRLASTIKNRSAQQLVTQALDKFLAEIPEIEALAAQVQRD